MKKIVKSFLISAVSVFGVLCIAPSAVCKESKPAASYYTVKTEKDLRDAVNLSNKGDKIVITGDIQLNSTLIIPKDKELTISNDGEVRTIKRGNTYKAMIQISQDSVLTLKGINGTDEEPCLLIDGDGNNKSSHSEGSLVINNGTFNMYTGVSLQNNKIGSPDCSNTWGCAVHCATNSTFNMYGGSISRDQMTKSGYYNTGIIFLSSGSRFNMSGGIISNNICLGVEHGIIHCGTKSLLNISGGEIFKNNVGIYCESNSVVNMTNGHITENGYGIYSLGKFVMSGGTIANNKKGLEIKGEFVLSQNAQIVANDICLAKDKKIVIDGFIAGNKDSLMSISLQEYKLFNTQKIIDVINGARLGDVVGKFKLCDNRYGINHEGYVDDVYQDFEKTDAATGIRISSCENVLGKDVEISITKTDGIDNVKDATFYVESLCDNVKSLYGVQFIQNGKQYVPQQTDKITFYIPIKEFDTAKIPEIKLYDSNKKTLSESGEVKSVNGMLYVKIPTVQDNLQ